MISLELDKRKQIAGIVPAIEKARLYRGKGGEIMRSTVSRLIECISLTQLSLPVKIKQSLLGTLNENLRHPNSQIQSSAVKAFKHFVQAYHADPAGKDAGSITSNFLELLIDPNAAIKKGSALALGVLTYELLAARWRDILLKLCRCTAIEDNPEDRDAEARMNAVKGLVSVCEALTIITPSSKIISAEDEVSLFHVIKDEVMTSLFTALNDYSVDNRGDVGSWVREAAMQGLERCTYILCNRDSTHTNGKSLEIVPASELRESCQPRNDQTFSLFDFDLGTKLVGGIAKQAVEKMDKLREAAANVLQRILCHKTMFVPFIPHREKIESIILKGTDLKWADPSFSYPRFVQLLQFGCYSRSVLSGLVISVGGLQESLRKASLAALLNYLQGDEDRNKSPREYMLSTDILSILQEFKRRDRVIIPTLKTVEILFSKMVFLNMEAHTLVFCSGLLDSLMLELKGSKDFSKLYAGISILGYISSVSEPINVRALSYLLNFLTHRYPKIRKASAEQVYLVLLQNDNMFSEDRLEKAIEIVSEACWEGDLETAKQRKSELYDLTGLDAGQARSDKVTKESAEKRLPTVDENASYSSLVESSGF